MESLRESKHLNAGKKKENPSKRMKVLDLRNSNICAESRFIGVVRWHTAVSENNIFFNVSESILIYQ